MDHTSHTRLAGNELTPEFLDRATIYGADDEEIGTVSHLHGSQIVIDVGGFLGIGAKPVLSLPTSWTSCVTQTVPSTP